ncbi:MAG: NAD(P)-dependent oxidoreductase [Robiginitomaculum sp.]|nr:NAD(P)-dependent oxidoreductase [Robiginitomaculum sp.]MDQ7076276.1 NAD(P)-dependent oxidoreductase [Robiginitomaculum sp.]
MGEHPVVSKTGKALSAEDIAANFEDLHPPLNAEQVSVEASRCLFCHDAPCVAACPTSIDIPKFIRQIATGNLAGSARTILSANIMGGTCARACPTEILCEQKCVLNTGEHDPIEIGALQRHAVDHQIAKGGPHPFARAPKTGKSIAVIGAGPAGLTCAHALAVQGHTVEIFEARQKPGGLNEYGLAAYKMAEDFAAREVDFILKVGGITLHYNQALGRDIAFADLQTRFDAVFMGIGLGRPRKLGLAGENLGGVMDALQFIEDIRQADDPAQMDPGENVVVIGGGNTAIDAAIQAKRLGARSVTLVYRRGPTQMGATQWEQDLAAINGVTMMHWAKPERLIGEDVVHTVHFERTCLQDGNLVGTGDHFTLLADRVYTAIGQELYDQGLASLRCESGKIMVDEAGHTSLPGVFAGGDCIASGEDLTVQAVEDGKVAAAGIHTYLGEQNG